MECLARSQQHLVGPSWNFCWDIGSHSIFMIVGPFRIDGPRPLSLLQIFLMEQTFWQEEIMSSNCAHGDWKTSGDEEVLAIIRPHPMAMVKQVASHFPPPEELCCLFDIDWLEDVDVDQFGYGQLLHIPFCSLCEEQLEVNEEMEFDYGEYMEALAEMQIENQIDAMREDRFDVENGGGSPE